MDVSPKLETMDLKDVITEECLIDDSPDKMKDDELIAKLKRKNRT